MSPCMDCKQRQTDCHTYCSTYQSWKRRERTAKKQWSEFEIQFHDSEKNDRAEYGHRKVNGR